MIYRKTTSYLLSLFTFCLLLLCGSLAQAQNKIIKGTTKDVDGNPVQGVTVELPQLGKAVSNSYGKFSIEYFSNKESSRKVKIEKKGFAMVDYTMKGGDLAITLRQLATTLKGKVFAQKNTPMGNASVIWKGVNDYSPIQTDAVGNFYMSVPSSKKVGTNTSFVVNGKEIGGKYFSYSSSTNEVRIVLSGDLSNPVIATKAKRAKNNQPKDDKKEDSSEEESEQDTTAMDTERINLEILVNDLELQKQLLTEQGFKIRSEMERIAEQLNSNKTELSTSERNRLRRELDKLAQQLISNETAFETAQAETRKLMERMRGLIFEKDSITNVFTDRLEEAEAEKESAKLRTIIAVIIAIFALLIAVGAYFVYMKINKQKNTLEQTNQDLTRTKDELEDRIEQIEKLNKEVTTQNQKITDSIRYAQTIQEAILPQHIEFEKVFSDHFVMYLPKDMVSGDFYWMANHYGTEGRITVIATIDCTGHGVPGAFMSMIGNTLLNEIVNQEKVFDTAQILTRLHEGVKKSLQQNELSNDDGMDVAICSIFFNSDDSANVQFTGAKRPLYYFQNSKLQTLKGDVKSIGGRDRKHKPFTTQDIYLMKGDCLYLMSDGYSDQNSHVDKRKYGSSRLLERLELNATLPMSIQKQELVEELSSHQGQAEQRDDITIVGVRI